MTLQKCVFVIVFHKFLFLVHYICHFFWDSFTSGHRKYFHISWKIVQFLCNYADFVLRNVIMFVIISGDQEIFYAFLDVFPLHWQKWDIGSDHMFVYYITVVHATLKKSIIFTIYLRNNHCF